jgi:2-oxo-4-hydroxy-4-carboxy-5-ureidoimidazoline decarboxylase
VTVTDLDAFNGLASGAARSRLSACCAAPGWIAAVAAGRPYPTVAALLASSDAAVAAMRESDLRSALDGHPRIGDRPALGSWSDREQARVSDADEAVRQALAAGNAAYEQRFGHIYLACATGRSGAELLAFLRERLGNDPSAEWRVVAAELAKINRIRLRALIGAGTSEPVGTRRRAGDTE